MNFTSTSTPTELSGKVRSLISDLIAEAREDTRMNLNILRLEEDEAMAKKCGFALPPPIYSLGTPVLPVGVANFRDSRLAWEKLPPAKRVAETAAALIALEDRIDYVVDPQNLRMKDSGELIFAGRSLGVTRRALTQLANAVAPVGTHAGSYLPAVETDIRAYGMNKHLSGIPRVKRGLKLRTRLDNGERTVFAVVGAGFPNFDTNHVLSELSSILPPDARGVFRYSGDGGRMVFDSLYHTDIRPEDACAGEIFKVGLRMTTADDGSAAYKTGLLAYRNLCLNFIIIGQSEVLLGRVVHKGEVERIKNTIMMRVMEGTGRLDGFSHKWSTARKEQVLQYGTLSEATEVYQSLIGARVLKVPGRSEDVAALMAESWAVEPGRTKADLVNGITRYAQTSAWTPSKWAEGSEVEVAAGNLLYATVNWARVI